MESGSGDFPGRNGFRVTATQMTDDPEVVRRAAGGRMIAIAARGHQRLGAEVGGFVEVPADEGDRAARIQRMTLDAVLAKFPGTDEGAVDPLDALSVTAEPCLGDPVQQGESRRVCELALVRAQVLNDRGMVAGSREGTGFRDNG